MWRKIYAKTAAEYEFKKACMLASLHTYDHPTICTGLRSCVHYVFSTLRVCMHSYIRACMSACVRACAHLCVHEHVHGHARRCLRACYEGKTTIKLET